MEATIRAKIRERVTARLAAGYRRDWSDPNPDGCAPQLFDAVANQSIANLVGTGMALFTDAESSHNSDPACRRRAAVVGARLSLRPVNQSRESVLAATARTLISSAASSLDGLIQSRESA
jgi:hypothetical protein